MSSAIRWCCAVALAGMVCPQVGRSQTPEWASRAVCYEIFIRSYYDSDGDGVGDLKGLTQKLDYISNLGASCLWLMPVTQSPSYHGYDVTNYFQVNRDYGTNEDFKQLMAEAHRRGIRVLVDLVLNHSSSEHPYFRSALLDPASPYRDWYLWSPTQKRMRDWQAETWHRSPARDEYYYGVFWQGMPDLNLANPAVTAEARRIARFWLQDMGVDGFRFDAVGLFFEDGDNPRNGPAVHPWLRDYQAYIRSVKPDAFTVGEVWDSIGTIRTYYPDQLDSYFAFPVADALIGAVRSGSGRDLLAALERTQREFPSGRSSIFQRNHDQTRTLTEFRGDVARAGLSAALLLTLPGIPFIYYGEELGMTGDKPDQRLRTPMPWSRRAGLGFTSAVPWEPAAADSFTANVEAQDGDPGSLLNRYRRLVRLRTSRQALASSAAFVPLATGSDSVLAYLRGSGDSAIVVIANLTGVVRSGPALTTPTPVLARGRFATTALLGSVAGASLDARDGRLRGWMPAARLQPFEAVVIELAAQR